MAQIFLRPAQEETIFPGTASSNQAQRLYCEDVTHMFSPIEAFTTKNARQNLAPACRVNNPGTCESGRRLKINANISNLCCAYLKFRSLLCNRGQGSLNVLIRW
jgi:hypothetical protein